MREILKKAQQAILGNQLDAIQDENYIVKYIESRTKTKLEIHVTSAIDHPLFSGSKIDKHRKVFTDLKEAAIYYDACKNNDRKSGGMVHTIIEIIEVIN